ncbi:MAG: hypothetical protein II178_01260, partial [Selenomonadaceae bacterium]|nr:hypothetical protein [Selenomonadaceae bacterium]
KGRGGTILQPGVDLLLEAKDFPKDAPGMVSVDMFDVKKGFLSLFILLLSLMLVFKELVFFVVAGFPSD